MIPEISSSGLLTVTVTTFWRKGNANTNSLVVNGSTSGVSTFSNTLDSSDSRFDRLVTVYRQQRAVGPQTLNLSMGSCCRVASGGLGNWVESSWNLDSRLVWDGTGGAKPIDFNFASVQSQVNRSSFYSDNLDATSPDGLMLSYNQNLNLNITSQIPAFTIDPNTGQMFIAAGFPGTQSITDNTTLSGQNVGADAAFSGNIVASDGSFVEFDWMFDGVNQTANLAPNVSDATFSGAPGTLFNYVFTITDPNNDSPLTFDAGFFSILGPGAAIAATFNHLTGQFSWDSTGSAPGTYIWQVRGRDPGGLTDVGSITINLVAQGDSAVPEPASFLIMVGMVGLVGGTSLARRRWMKR
jgi:hypothetical protein